MIQWTIKQIFDGDYGCEELKPGEKPMVSVTLIDDDGNEKYVSVEDEWLTDNELEVGDRWPVIHVRYGRLGGMKLRMTWSLRHKCT